MPSRIASLLETTVVVVSLLAGVVFSYSTFGASYFAPPTSRANATAAATFSGIQPRAAESRLLRVRAADCAENDCDDSDSPLRAERKTPEF